MSWLRSPVTLFGSAAVLLFLLRLFFPPAHFPGVLQAHVWAKLFGLRMDLTGYGLYEFPAIVFVLCALAYYFTSRLTGQMANRFTIRYICPAGQPLNYGGRSHRNHACLVSTTTKHRASKLVR